MIGGSNSASQLCEPTFALLLKPLLLNPTLIFPTLDVGHSTQNGYLEVSLNTPYPAGGGQNKTTAAILATVTVPEIVPVLTALNPQESGSFKCRSNSTALLRRLVLLHSLSRAYTDEEDGNVPPLDPSFAEEIEPRFLRFFKSYSLSTPECCDWDPSVEFPLLEYLTKEHVARGLTRRPGLTRKLYSDLSTLPLFAMVSDIYLAIDELPEVACGNIYDLTPMTKQREVPIYLAVESDAYFSDPRFSGQHYILFDKEKMRRAKNFHIVRGLPNVALSEDGAFLPEAWQTIEYLIPQQDLKSLRESLAGPKEPVRELSTISIAAPVNSTEWSTTDQRMRAQEVSSFLLWSAGSDAEARCASRTWLLKAINFLCLKSGRVKNRGEKLPSILNAPDFLRSGVLGLENNTAAPSFYDDAVTEQERTLHFPSALAQLLECEPGDEVYQSVVLAVLLFYADVYHGDYTFQFTVGEGENAKPFTTSFRAALASALFRKAGLTPEIKFEYVAETPTLQGFNSKRVALNHLTVVSPLELNELRDIVLSLIDIDLITVASKSTMPLFLTLASSVSTKLPNLLAANWKSISSGLCEGSYYECDPFDESEAPKFGYRDVLKTAGAVKHFLHETEHFIHDENKTRKSSEEPLSSLMRMQPAILDGVGGITNLPSKSGSQSRGYNPRYYRIVLVGQHALQFAFYLLSATNDPQIGRDHLGYANGDMAFSRTVKVGNAKDPRIIPANIAFTLRDYGDRNVWFALTNSITMRVANGTTEVRTLVRAVDDDYLNVCTFDSLGSLVKQSARVLTEKEKEEYQTRATSTWRPDDRTQAFRDWILSGLPEIKKKDFLSASEVWKDFGEMFSKKRNVPSQTTDQKKIQPTQGWNPLADFDDF